MDEILCLLDQYGLWAIGVGAFFQGYLMVLAGGIMASQNLLPITDVLLVAAGSAWMGHWFLYGIGYWLNRNDYLKSGGRMSRPVQALDKTIRLHPWSSVFLMQYSYGIRLASAVAFGYFRVNSLWFAGSQLLNCGSWAIVLVFLGYFAGIGLMELPSGTQLWTILALTSLVMLLLLVRRHWKNDIGVPKAALETLTVPVEKESRR